MDSIPERASNQFQNGDSTKVTTAANGIASNRMRIIAMARLIATRSEGE